MSSTRGGRRAPEGGVGIRAAGSGGGGGATASQFSESAGARGLEKIRREWARCGRVVYTVRGARCKTR
eukprot:scaffold49043_cov69-Phaeocystis_antarctica.AAC.8